MIKSVIWSSMVDYPNNICTTLFFDGCNFNCEFCYNKKLYKEKEINFDNEILPRLIERKHFINHVILSGGECTINSQFEYVVKKLYENDFYIGIQTNGYEPDIIEKVIDKLDFIGMDIKNDFENYDLITKAKVDIKKIKKSIRIIIDSNIDYEFRTTVYPKYVKGNNLEKIAKYLKFVGAKEYILQNYYDYNNSCYPYTMQELEEMQKKCSKYLITKIRGI